MASKKGRKGKENGNRDGSPVKGSKDKTVMARRSEKIVTIVYIHTVVKSFYRYLHK